MNISNSIRISLVALLTMFAVEGASADSLMFNNPDNKAYLGARVSVDVSSAANGGNNYSSKAGFAIGAVYHIPVKANFYFEPGLALFYDVFGTVIYNYDYPNNAPGTFLPEDENEEGKKLYQTDGSVRNLGFRVPLNLGYHFDFGDDLRLRVFTGPQLNVSFLARYHQNQVVAPFLGVIKGHSHSVFGTGGFKHFDAQWNFGAGFDYGNYSIDLAGSVGMTTLCDQVAPFQHNIRRNIFSITLGYNF